MGAIAPDKRILVFSKAYSGKDHDKGILNREQWVDSIPKEENRELASERVVCEHAFAGVKRYGIATNIYRNRVKDFEDHSMFTAAGLWNFYLIAA